MPTLKILLLVVNLVALAAIVVLYLRVKRTHPKSPRVEAPNSTHQSRYVRDVESKRRWERLDLERMHAVNRVEVERVLRKLKATSIRGLTHAEVAFLDRMVEAQGRGPMRRPSAGKSISSSPTAVRGGTR